MGYDRHQQSNSAGTLVAVIGVGLVLAILGIVAVAGIGLFWVRASVQQERAVAMEQRAIAEARRAEVEAQRAVVMARLEQDRNAAPSTPRFNFEIAIDREGNTSVDGKEIGLDELKARLAKLKDGGDAFSVRIDADPDCPAKHIIPVLDICQDVGGIDIRITLPKDSVVPTGEDGAG